MEQTVGLFCTCDSGVARTSDPCGVQIVAAANQVYVTHEAMNSCKNLKIC